MAEGRGVLVLGQVARSAWSSPSSKASFRLPKDTRAAFTTDRSEPMWSMSARSLCRGPRFPDWPFSFTPQSGQCSSGLSHGRPKAIFAAPLRDRPPSWAAVSAGPWGVAGPQAPPAGLRPGGEAFTFRSPDEVLHRLRRPGRDPSASTPMGVIDGVTTNPSLVAKTGKPFEKVIRRSGGSWTGRSAPRSSATGSGACSRRAATWRTIHPNIVVKVPLIADGIRPARR